MVLVKSEAKTASIDSPSTSSLLGCVEWRSSLDNGDLRRWVLELGQHAKDPQHDTLYLHLLGDKGDDPAAAEAVQAPSPELIRALGVLYDALSTINPRIRAIPLLSLAGWTAGQAATALLGNQCMLAAGSDARSKAYVHSVQQQLQAAGRPASMLPALSSNQQGHQHSEHISLPQILLPPPTDAQPQPAAASTPASTGNASSLPSSLSSEQQVAQGHVLSTQPPLLFSRVAVGGTFDRLHCGHELLLATTALVAKDKVYVGITADKLLANKNHRELLQTYDQRCAAAVGFMRAVRPGVDVEAGALSDPQAPTEAELDPLMEALVVSQETLPGAAKINEGRIARGFKPLLVLVVPVIGGQDAKTKLSSTQLRAQDAAAAAAAATSSLN